VMRVKDVGPVVAEEKGEARDDREFARVVERHPPDRDAAGGELAGQLSPSGHVPDFALKPNGIQVGDKLENGALHADGAERDKQVDDL
jgi:hypothetical protein